jgi:hypothetical protein
VSVFPRRLLTRLTGRLRGTSWHWNVTAANGEIVEWGEAYQRRIDAVTAAERHHPRVEIGEQS